MTPEDVRTGRNTTPTVAVSDDGHHATGTLLRTTCSAGSAGAISPTTTETLTIELIQRRSGAIPA